MAGFVTTLLTCLAQHLEDAGVGVWSPDGTYARTDLGIYLKAIPGTTGVRDEGYCLSYYAVSDEATDPGDRATVAIAGVQVRSRGTKDPRVVDDMDDTVFDVLHGAQDLLLGSAPGVPVLLAWRNSHANLGQDESGRWEAVSNYYLHLTRPRA
ncbi:minor capsid protein [Enterococcus hirae]|uniref:minor capsid protein n=1 Tax=Enterococcus hirae TaxID=1354 RepID=UPI00136F69F7|nr:minor capsid protein [Enterococcus hirae]NAE18080.1 hypothetical protein [Enterococcus hirae]